jgi:ribosome-associated protein
VAEPGLPGKRSVNGLHVPGGPLIPESELRWRYSASGGPGGQHVNTSNTRAEVFFDIEASTVFDEAQRQLLVERLGRVVRVVASDERSQWRNRRLAAERLGDRLADALEIPPERRPTRPSRREQERRRTSRVRQQAKRTARRWTYDDDG